MKRQKGVALILAIGILAVVAMIATAFALNMRLEYKIAVNYHNRVKARYIAEAGVQKAIAELREQVRTSAFDSLASSSSNVVAADGFTHSASAVIADEQGKLNINNCDVAMLENLIDILINRESLSSLSTSDANTIIALRPSSGYLNLQDIIVRVKNVDPAFDEEKIALLEPYITTSSYQDPNNSDRSPVNINTASRALIAAVMAIDPISADVTWGAAEGLVNSGLTSWSEFNDTIDGAVDPGIATIIKNDCNPNRVADATKFCFHPGGYYTITATGIARDGAGNDLSTETISVIAKINEIYTETTKQQFESGTTDGTTFLDSCPDGPEDAVKLGFWDDFDETLTDDTLFSIGEWSGVSSGDIYDADGDGNNELVTASWGLFAVPGSDWGNFYFSVAVGDLGPPGYQMKDVPWVQIRDAATSCVHARQGPLEWGGAWAYDTGGTIEFFTDSDAIAGGYDPSTDKYIYDSQLRLWPGSNQDTDAERTLIGYQPTRTYEITADGPNVTLNVGSPSFTRNDITDTSGGISLYSHSISAAWDDVRVIGSSGSFASDAFSPPEGNVEWGTITGTFENQDEGDITITAQGSGISSSSISLSSSNPYATITGTSISINYEANFSQNAGDTSHTGCPVLEDVTITYLPQTEILSYTLR